MSYTLPVFVIGVCVCLIVILHDSYTTKRKRTLQFENDFNQLKKQLNSTTEELSKARHPAINVFGYVEIYTSNNQLREEKEIEGSWGRKSKTIYHYEGDVLMKEDEMVLRDGKWEHKEVRYHAKEDGVEVMREYRVGNEDYVRKSTHKTKRYNVVEIESIEYEYEYADLEGKWYETLKKTNELEEYDDTGNLIKFVSINQQSPHLSFKLEYEYRSNKLIELKEYELVKGSKSAFRKKPCRITNYGYDKTGLIEEVDFYPYADPEPQTNKIFYPRNSEELLVAIRSTKAYSEGRVNDWEMKNFEVMGNMLTDDTNCKIDSAKSTVVLTIKKVES